MKKIALKDLKFLDEVDILYPKPKKIHIGDKFIIIKELPISAIGELSKKFNKLLKKFKLINNIKVPDSIAEVKKDLPKFSESIKIIETLLHSKKFRKVFSRLLKTVMPEIGSKGFPSCEYIENTITITEAIQIIIAIWSYNFAADIDSKKKIQEILKDMEKI